ncbi:glycosyltransferase [Pontibacter toksunensis]|uniref:Glycosyltransferase n=1 Tax=Pontibacter toksunensis TaxID=1332631 RepID=A0ABW6BRX8_9BACT
MAKKKVIIVGPAHPLRGGLATYNERLAQAFQDEGDDVELVTFTLQYPDFLFPGKTQFSGEPKPEGLRIKPLINSVNPLSWLRVGMYLYRQRADIVIFRFWLPFMGPAFGTIARIVKRNKHTRIVALTDNVIPHEQRPGDRPFTQYFLSACHGFVTMSRAVLGDLARYQPAKPAVYQPHPLYDNYGEATTKAEARQALNLAEQGKYVLFFGFIRAYKGLDLLLEAFSDQRIKALGLKLVIAGEFYEDAIPYENIIAKHQLEPFLVRATGFIPNSKVRDYFCAADVVVQPYKSATQSGVSQIAYHFNKPMIVTDVGGLAELVPDEKVGYVVQPDAASLANAIVRYFDEDNEEMFLRNIELQKQKFSWHAMTQAVRQAALK